MNELLQDIDKAQLPGIFICCMYVDVFNACMFVLPDAMLCVSRVSLTHDHCSYKYFLLFSFFSSSDGRR